MLPLLPLSCPLEAVDSVCNAPLAPLLMQGVVRATCRPFPLRPAPLDSPSTYWVPWVCARGSVVTKVNLLLPRGAHSLGEVPVSKQRHSINKADGHPGENKQPVGEWLEGCRGLCFCLAESILLEMFPSLAPGRPWAPCPPCLGLPSIPWADLPAVCVDSHSTDSVLHTCPSTPSFPQPLRASLCLMFCRTGTVCRGHVGPRSAVLLNQQPRVCPTEVSVSSRTEAGGSVGRGRDAEGYRERNQSRSEGVCGGGSERSHFVQNRVLCITLVTSLAPTPLFDPRRTKWPCEFYYYYIRCLCHSLGLFWIEHWRNSFWLRNLQKVSMAHG